MRIYAPLGLGLRSVLTSGEWFGGNLW